MAVSSNTLCWLLKHENLSARSCRLSDLQAIPWLLLIDQAGRSFTQLEFAVLGFLFREAAALLAAPVLTLATDLLGFEICLAYMAFTMNADSDRLLDSFCGRIKVDWNLLRLANCWCCFGGCFSLHRCHGGGCRAAISFV
jgi:hypothetical protein